MGSTNILDMNNRISALEKAVDEVAESYPANKVMMSDGVTSVEDVINNVMKPGNLLAGTIGIGDTILAHITDANLPIGISIWYTQRADDSPYSGTVSFTIINKPTADGTYSQAYNFSTNHISCATMLDTIPQELTWNVLT